MQLYHESWVFWWKHLTVMNLIQYILTKANNSKNVNSTGHVTFFLRRHRPLFNTSCQQPRALSGAFMIHSLLVLVISMTLLRK